MNAQAKQDVPESRYVPCKLSRKVLAGMAAALDKNGTRQYAHYIGIKNGKACVTNGFALAYWESESLKGYETQLDADLFPTSGVRFPDWEEQVIVKVGTPIPNVLGIAHLMACYKAPKKGVRYPNRPYLAVRGGSVSLEVDPKGADAVFDPTILAQFLKAVPGGLVPTSALIDSDKERLQIRFGEEGKFSVLIVAVKMPED